MASSNRQPSSLETPEPGGPAQSLPTAGLITACAASQCPETKWLRAYLGRVLHESSSLRLQSGARKALIEQAVEISRSDNPVTTAVDVVDGYLSASCYSLGQAVPLVSALLHADVIHSTSYDSRARETLMRLVGVLHLPPRILYHAERELATLVHAVAANATAKSGENVESVGEDPLHARRRKNMKWLKVGAASVVGGLALGLSGGLIAPALLPALGTVGLAGVSAPLAAMGGGGAVAVGSLFGAAGAGVGAAAMSSRHGDVEEFRFERCTVLAEDRGGVKYETVRISPSNKTHEVFVPLTADEGEESVVGGLLVWEMMTSQDYAMVVPGRIAFGVQFQKFSEDGEKHEADWLLPEELMDVGGFDKIGESRRRRTTGAVTVLGHGLYKLCFRLLPGSLEVKISYRVALVPPGKDAPLWVMDENENQVTDREKNDIRSLSMAILIPGLINTGENGSYPGMCADMFASTAGEFAKFDIECFALRWESNLLLELSNALRKLIGRMALSMVAQNGAMMIVPAVVGAVALPVSIIGALRTLIGNVWAKTITHAGECGYMLAAELASRSFGNRPIVLAGFSAGAMVIFSCLQELARRDLVGIVHDVFLVGAPCTADVKTWREIRKVVSGRLVNAYCPTDWYLEIYHRGTNLGAVAGTRCIQDRKGIANVENVCLTSEQVGNHMDYAKCCSQILLDLGIADGERRRPWSNKNLFDENGDELDISTQSRTEGKVEVERLEGLADLDDEDVLVFQGNGARTKAFNRASSA